MSYGRVAFIQARPGGYKEAARKAHDSLLPLFQKMPGFISYRLIEGEGDRGASLTEWQTKEQADASVKTASDWVQKNTADLFLSYSTFAGEMSSGTSSGIAAVEAIHAAFNGKDFSRLDRVLVPGAKLTNMPHGNEVPVREDFETWATAFPDGQIEITSAFESGNNVCVEYTGRGTNTGPLRTPIGTFPPTGRRAELQLVDVVTIRDGKIAAIRTYFDTYSLMSQLGLTPTMAAPPPAKAVPQPEVRH